MGDQTLIKSKRLKAVKLQKRRTIVPDIMLHTENILIPILEPMLKQNFNIHLTKNKPQILRAQKYRNSPALLFSETPSHILYNHLKNLFKVKKIKQGKLRNQSTKYTIFDKMDSSSIKKTNILQNSYPSKKQSYKKKSNTLHFPNTMLGQLESLAKDKELQNTNSRSIHLSRKYNMPQLKGSWIKDENKLIVTSKIETPISDVMNRPQIISMPSDIFYNITNTVSTISTLSESSFRIENKRTFVNIGNKEKSVSEVTLNPTNSEYEINILHYDTDILPENKSHFAAPHLNSADINWPLVEDINSVQTEDSIENLNKQNMWKSHRKRDTSKTICDIKYSWEALNNWTLSPQKGYSNSRGQQYFEMHGGKSYKCRMKYSWQVIEMSTQTSYSLLRDFLNDTDIEDRESSHKMCVKYSWQIIGTSTQTSLHDCNDSDWRDMFFTPNKNYNKNSSQIGNNERDVKSLDHAKYPERRLKRCLILNNQQIQTFAEKNVQTDVKDYYAKYSWHNLIKQCL